MDTDGLKALNLKSFSFLAEYQWIHNFPVTNILNEVSKIPDEWSNELKQLSYADLNNLPFMDAATASECSEWPEGLPQFLSDAASLSVDRSQNVSGTPAVLGAGMSKGMNPKKRHEVEWMASLVAQIVEEAKCHMIVDVGSGLGYLDHVLHQVYGHPVLGLETCQSHTSAAEQRAAQQGISCGGVINRKFNITSSAECFRELEALIQREAESLTCRCQHRKVGATEGSQSFRHEGEDLRVCVIGLHCCGDLSTSMLSLFDHMKDVKALCFVSCCYHKMAFSDNRFTNFPMSHSGKDQYRQVTENHPPCPVSPCTLRLGAQETKCRWRTQTDEDHASHLRHVAYRGLLEFTDIPSSVIRQRVRKCDFSSFQSFLASYFQGDDPQETYQSQASVLQALYEEHLNSFDLIEPLTCLQVVVQPVIESLIYRDRLLWLKERGHHNSHILPVFDDVISPRNLALVAIKDR